MFELSRLVTYDDDALLTEMRRVAALITGPLTCSAFRRVSKASPSVYQRRFGSWQDALKRADLQLRYSGRTVSDKMRRQEAKHLTNEQMLAELQRVAALSSPLTTDAFNQHSNISAAAIRARFGSWNAALKQAALQPANMGRRYAEDEYFENLLAVWSALGRQPSYSEMNRPPSMISSGGYEKRWGTWRKALSAFLERVNAKSDAVEVQLVPSTSSPELSPSPAAPRDPRRKVPLSLRFSVLRRDNFTCVLCGGSPAKGAPHPLQVDHIEPWSLGGRTQSANLRTLCQLCNLGRSNTNLA